jgi:cyclohexanone monooxygenase
VFQRTPSSIDVRNNRPTDPEWAASLEPGWQQRRMDNFNSLVTGGIEAEDMVSDGWTDIIGKLLLRLREAEKPDLSAQGLAETMELADFEKMEQIRARVDTIVNDPNTAEALKPYYRQFCKRPCFHDEYLDTFNRPNVQLVDTNGKGVDRITERGVVANGTEYELDCLIFATGFEVGTDYTRRAGCELIGRDGLTLTEKWKDGASTLHGMHTRGFPNCFIVSNTQSGFTVNFPHMLNEQSKHLAYIISHAQQQGVTIVEASQEAEDAWVQTILDLAQVNLKFLESCTPGYYNNEGKPSERGIRNGFYGAGPVAFVKLLEAWRATGELEGLELRTDPVSV